MLNLRLSRGEVSDYVLMEGRGFGFVTYADPAHAQAFLEVGCQSCSSTTGLVSLQVLQ